MSNPYDLTKQYAPLNHAPHRSVVRPSGGGPAVHGTETEVSKDQWAAIPRGTYISYTINGQKRSGGKMMHVAEYKNEPFFNLTGTDESGNPRKWTVYFKTVSNVYRIDKDSAPAPAVQQSAMSYATPYNPAPPQMNPVYTGPYQQPMPWIPPYGMQPPSQFVQQDNEYRFQKIEKELAEVKAANAKLQNEMAELVTKLFLKKTEQQRKPV